jgi:hypothetical protein
VAQTRSKIVPAADPQSGKAIQDRVGEQAAAERLMPGAEQPMDMRTPGPRVVLPPPVQPAAGASSGPVSERTVTTARVVLTSPAQLVFIAATTGGHRRGAEMAPLRHRDGTQTHKTIVQLIGATTTENGLTVRAELDTNT